MELKMCQHNHNSLFPMTLQNCFHLESNSQSRTVRWKGKIQLCLPAWLGPWVPGDLALGYDFHLLAAAAWYYPFALSAVEGRDTGAGCACNGTRSWLVPFPSICHWACPFHTGANSSLSNFMPSSLHVLCVTDNDGSHYFIGPPQ